MRNGINVRPDAIQTVEEQQQKKNDSKIADKQQASSNVHKSALRFR